MPAESEAMEEVETPKEMERDWRVDFLVNNLLPDLPAPDWYDESKISDEELEKSQEQLARAYLNIVDPALTGPVSIILLLVLIDTAGNISPVSYGLALSIWASTVMLVPSLKSPSVIASISTGDHEVARRLHSEEMAYNNVGFALLGAGFILQIFGLHADTHLIETALLTDEVSSIVSTISIFAAVIIPLYVPEKVRKLLPIPLILCLGFLHFI